MSRPTIVVFGSTGTVGQEVMKQLRNEYCDTRGIIRHPSKHPSVKINSTEHFSYMSVNLNAKEHIERACLNADSIFLLTATNPNQVENEINIINAALDSGVKRIVKLSAPIINDLAVVEVSNWHRQIDDYLSKCNVEYSLLQPFAFMQNWERNTFTMNRFGKFYGSSGNAKRNFIDCRDVAEVAVKELLKKEKLSSNSIPLHGPEAISNFEMAQRLSYYTENKIEYINLTPEDHLNMLLKRAKLPIWLAKHIVELDQLAVKCPEPLKDNVEEILNRKARTMDAYLQQNRDKFKRMPWYKI